MAARTQRPNRRRAKPGAGRSPLASCALCQEKVAWVDYKDIGLLRRYMSDRGKIRARQSTGNCAQHQGEVSVAIKTARELVLLPYAQRTATERRTGRRSGARHALECLRRRSPRQRSRRRNISYDIVRAPRGGGHNRGWSIMKVLLRSDISGVGKKGDIVDVAKGFARNFLFPTGSALVASEGIEAQAASMRKSRALRDAQDKESAQAVAEVLGSATVTITAHAGAGVVFRLGDDDRRGGGGRGPDRRRARSTQDPSRRADQVGGDPRHPGPAARRGRRRVDRRGHRRLLTRAAPVGAPRVSHPCERR